MPTVQGSMGARDCEATPEREAAPLLVDTPSSSRSRSGDGGSAPRGDVVSSTINLLNTLIGSGMLALPYAFSKQGVALGLLTLTLAALGSMVGQRMLAECARGLNTRTSSYGALAEAVLPQGLVLIDLAVAIKCFGVATSYLLVIGDQLPAVARWAGQEGALEMREVWILVAVAAVAPLVCLPRLDALKFTSVVALAAAAYLVGLVCAYAWVAPLYDTLPCKQPQADPACVHHPVLLGSGVDVLNVLPIFVFSFTCHQNIFLVHNELRDNSGPCTTRAIANAVAGALTVYYVVALSGYSTFGPAVEPDILVMYPSNAAVTACRAAIAVLVLFSIPLQTAPCRQHLLHLLEWAAPATARRHHALAFAVITGILVVCSAALALNVTSLGMMLSVVGATASTTLGYVLPGAFHYQMFKTEKNTFRSVAAGCMCALGFVIMFIALTAIFVFHSSE